MIYRTRPRNVEARRVPEKPNSAEMVELRRWLDVRGLNLAHCEERGYFHVYRESQFLTTAFTGSWIVIKGESDVSSLTVEQFEKTYEWIGPVAHADAPYMVN